MHGDSRSVREQICVLIGIADQRMLLRQGLGTNDWRAAGRGLDSRHRLLKEGFRQGEHALVAVDPLLQRLRAGCIDAARRESPRQADDAPQLALAYPALDGKQQLAQPAGVRTDLAGLAQDQTGLARGVEHPLLLGQHHRAGAIGPGVGAQQGGAADVTDLDALGVDAHQYLGADGRRARGVAAVIHPHAAVVAYGAHRLVEILHAQQRQRLEVGALLLEHGLHLAPLGAVNALGCPVLLPVRQELVLGLDGFESPALQGRGLGVADGMLHRALAIGVTHPRRVGHHGVVRQGGGVHRVEIGLVQVGLQDAFLEVVQHHVLRAAAKVAKGLLVQLGPDLLAGLPDHAPEAGARVAQRGHEQPRFAIPIAAGHAGGRPLAVVHLHLLAGQKAQAVELLGLLVPEPRTETLDRVVLAGKAVLVDQVLVDRRGVALQAQLHLDELAMGFAQRGGRRIHRRWPGWGNWIGRAGGHPGGI